MGVLYDTVVKNRDNISFVQNKISQKSILLQLAEECNEVAQQAIKLVRIYIGENPTPVTASEASEKLQEEIADFCACLDCLSGVNYDRINDIKQKKLERWRNRLENAEKKKVETEE